MADFRFFINRQGPRGPQGLQGEKGDPGNTFTVSEGVNTPTEYTLIFDGGDGNQFETDNLRNPIVDRGGTYVRYDRDNVVQYIGEPDMAVIDETPGIVNLAGKDTENPNASDAVAYELLEKTVDELNTALEGLDDRLDTDEGDISQAKSDIVGLDNRVTTNEGVITSLQSGKADKSTTYTKTEVNNALTGKANAVHTHTVSQITNAGALASQNTVDYQTQVTNKPIIPTVGNGTITLTQGGVTKGIFTTNQSGDSTIDLDAGGGSSLTAGSGINITNDTISVKVDGTTISTNNDGELTAIGNSGDTVAAGDGIVISPNVLVPGEKIIGVYYDGITINKNSSGQIEAIVPDVSHMVTDNTTQSITGTKTYGAGNLKINDLCLADGSKVIEDKGTYVYVGSPGVTTKIKSNNTKLYFNGQSGVDEEIAKVSQLPGAATSSALGLVQPDGTTIAVDANGVISANIPTPETVDQTYDATSTHAQSGVAIAGAGFLNGSIVQSPLEYLPDTTGSLTYQNVNTSTMVGSGKGIYVSYNGNATSGYTNISVGTESGSENFRTYTGDKANLISNSSLTWFETELTNGFNFSSKNKLNGNYSTYAAIIGHYENGIFIPDAFYGNGNSYLLDIYIVATNNWYATNGSSVYQPTILDFCLNGTVLTISGTGSDTSKNSVNITQADADILNAVTHIRIYNNNTNISTLALSDIKVINPTSATPVTDGSASERQTRFTNGTNIFDTHPESLSLKYDSTTLGVNSSGQLYAQSSTPSNMVTTDTNQIIAASKAFHPTGGLGYCQIGGYYGTHYEGYISAKRYDSNYPERSTLFAVNLKNNKGGNITFSDNNLNSIGGLSVDYDYLTLKSRTGTYYVQKNNSNNLIIDQSMLDGTTIQYNSTSGKVEVLGGGGSGTDLKQYSSEFTIEGSLVNTNGVLSSFSDLNYAKIPSKYFAVGNSIRVKFNFTTKSTGRQYVLAGEGFLNVDINTSSTTLRTWNNATSQNDNITTLASGQDYYLRIDLKNTGKDFYVTQDPSNWGTAVTVADTAYTSVTPPNEVITIGLNTAKTGSYWNSTIDSNYIEIYDGDGILIYKIDDNNQIATNQRLGLIKPDNQTVKVDEYGTLSTNISGGVGTSLAPNGNLNLVVSDCEYDISTYITSTNPAITVNDGLISISRTNDYASGTLSHDLYNALLIPRAVITNKNNFEIVIKANCRANFYGNGPFNIIGLPGICEFGFGDGNNLSYSLLGNYTCYTDPNVPLEGIIDKPKYWRIKRENTTLIFSYSNDGIDYIPLFTDFFFNNTNDLSGDISIFTAEENSNGSVGGYSMIDYSLDLKESYIKCDGTLTWGLYGVNGIAKASATTYGLVKIDGTTITTDSDGKLVAADTNTKTFPKYASSVYTDYTNDATHHNAPSDGYLCVNFELNAVENLYINGVKAGYGTRITGQFKVRSGDEFYISAAAAPSPFLYRFYPAEEVSK